MIISSEKLKSLKEKIKPANDMLKEIKTMEQELVIFENESLSIGYDKYASRYNRDYIDKMQTTISNKKHQFEQLYGSEKTNVLNSSIKKLERYNFYDNEIKAIESMSEDEDFYDTVEMPNLFGKTVRISTLLASEYERFVSERRKTLDEINHEHELYKKIRDNIDSLAVKPRTFSNAGLSENSIRGGLIAGASNAQLPIPEIEETIEQKLASKLAEIDKFLIKAQGQDSGYKRTVKVKQPDGTVDKYRVGEKYAWKLIQLLSQKKQLILKLNEDKKSIDNTSTALVPLRSQEIIQETMAVLPIATNISPQDKIVSVRASKNKKTIVEWLKINKKRIIAGIAGVALVASVLVFGNIISKSTSEEIKTALENPEIGVEDIITASDITSEQNFESIENVNDIRDNNTKLAKGSNIYATSYDAVYETNPDKPYYGTEAERIVIGYTLVKDGTLKTLYISSPTFSTDYEALKMQGFSKQAELIARIEFPDVAEGYVRSSDVVELEGPKL